MTSIPVANTQAARGTAILAVSQGCYFVLGYLAVVLLAREFGPAIYGAYGVIMSVLVWLEESGRYAIPSGAAKLVAESTNRNPELERAALALNLGLHALLFVVLWTAAPWLSSWFGIENGTFLFRIAAIDLPFFGVYTTFRSIHQGHLHFFQLGSSHAIYALAKLVGVLLLIRVGVSVQNALLANVGATIVGLACVFPGSGLRVHGAWLKQVKPLVSAATPIGLYYFVLGVRDSLVLWTLQVMTPASEAAIIGVFVAAFNIARVPSMVLTSVTTVILPALSRALALGDEPLAGRYINQALRFGVILYLPVCLVFMAQPEKIMQLIYSNDFSSGGIILSLLVAGQGLRVVHAILGAVLNAAGDARRAAVVTAGSIAPSLAILIFFIHSWGGAGAALASVLIIIASCAILGILVWNRFGTLMNKRSTCNIGVAGCLMFLVFAALANVEELSVLPYAGGLAVYFTSLIVFQEITLREFAAFVPWLKIDRFRASGG